MESSLNEFFLEPQRLIFKLLVVFLTGLLADHENYQSKLIAGNLLNFTVVIFPIRE